MVVVVMMTDSILAAAVRFCAADREALPIAQNMNGTSSRSGSEYQRLSAAPEGSDQPVP